MTISCNTPQGSYEITIRRGALKDAGALFNLKRKVLVVTDGGVPARYAETILRQCDKGYKYTFPAGEGSKTLATWQEILSMMLQNGFSRRDAVVAVGGGVAGDIAGFAAASYMRGVDFCNIPTTLLSQLDSSVGGKTGVNFEGIKNIVGAFKQPGAVIIDPDCLDTLPERLVHEGLAEAIKIAATSDAAFFEMLEECEDLRGSYESIIKRAVELKRDVVEADTFESGRRKILNFGHTIGHAIEAAAEGSLFHGEAVAAGMMYMCSPNLIPRLSRLLRKYNLPTTDPFDEETLMQKVAFDKKGSGGSIDCIYVPAPGKAEIVRMSLAQIRECISKLKTSV